MKNTAFYTVWILFLFLSISFCLIFLKKTGKRKKEKYMAVQTHTRLIETVHNASKAGKLQNS